MHKFYSTLLVLMLCVPLVAQNEPILVQEMDLTFRLDDTHKTAIVLGYANDIDPASAQLSHLTIPSTINHNGTDYTVSQIADSAFMGAAASTVSLPETLTQLGTYAFAKSHLTKVHLPSSLESLGENTFSRCADLRKVTFAEPSSLRVLSRSMFDRCTSLDSIEVPSSVIAIERNAFDYCSKLSYVSLPESLRLIREWAFYNCTSLRHLDIPSKVNYLDLGCFQGTGLEKLVLPDSISVIPQQLCCYCYSLQEVVIPSNVSVIKAFAFEYVPLSNIRILATTPPSLGNNVFSRADNYDPPLSTSINVPFESLDLYEGDTNEMGYGWANYFSADQFTHDKALDNWEGEAGLYYVFFDGKRHSFRINHVTRYWNQLVSWHLPDSLLGPDNLPYPVTEIANYAFSGLRADSIFLPKSLKKIGDYAFSHMQGLSSAFSHISPLPESVCSIGEHAFSNNFHKEPLYNSRLFAYFPYANGPERYQVPEGIECIVEGAFPEAKFYFPLLRELSLPESLKELKSFIPVENRLVCKAPIDNLCAKISTSHLDYLEGDLCMSNNGYYGLLSVDSLILSGEGLDNFYKLLNLGHYLDLSQVKDSIVPAYCFAHERTLKEIILPDSLTTIGQEAFRGCLHLQEIKLPSTVNKINEQAFEDCRLLAKVDFSSDSQLESIGNWAFYNCHELQELNLPEGLKSLGKAAFYDCHYLKNLSLPSSIENLDDMSFARCANIASIHVAAQTPPIIESKTFNDVDKTIPLRVPEGCRDLYANAPYWKDFQNISEGSATDLTQFDGSSLFVIEKGRVYCDEPFDILSLDGKIVNHLNGQLRGVYLVRIGENCYKIFAEQ